MENCYGYDRNTRREKQDDHRRSDGQVSIGGSARSDQNRYADLLGYGIFHGWHTVGADGVDNAEPG